jgi:enoyl-CoA hydratase/carnithine racemase
VVAQPTGVAVMGQGTELEVVLDHPEVRNALDTAMRDALVDVLRVAHADTTISRIVLRGAGPSFCSGGDLRQFGTFPDPATAHAVRATRSPAWWVAAEHDRITAVVHGACVGAGVELPAFVHQVVADPAATFRLPEVAFGLVPGAGGTVSVPRRIGRHRAAWMGLTGEVVDAETALAWGLVDHLAPVAAP